MVKVVPLFLLLSVLCGALAQVKFGQGADAPVNCNQLSFSCAKCQSSGLGCRYYWNQPGLYNTSANGTCTSTADFLAKRNNNLRVKTMYAFALMENEVSTTPGQYLIHSGVDSSKAYGALPVTCFDRHLCCCKKMPPPPLNNLTVIALDVFSKNPVTSAQVSVQCNKSFSASGVVDSRGARDFFRIPVDDTCDATGSAPPQYSYVNSSGPIKTGQGSSYLIYVYLAPAPCQFSVVVTSQGSFVPGASITFRGNTVNGSTTDGSFNFGALQAFTDQRVDASAAGYTTNFNISSCPSGGNVRVTIELVPMPNRIRVRVVTVDFGSTTQVNRPGASVSVSGPSFQSNSSTDANGEVEFVGTVASPLLGGSYFASGSFAGYIPVLNQAFPRALGLRNDFINTTIVLVQPPCITTIQVIDQQTGLPINGANVTISALGFTALTNASGFVAPQQVGSSLSAMNASATANGYETGAFTTFTCNSAGGVSNPNPVVIQLVRIVEFRLFGAERVSQSAQNPLGIGSLITQWFIQVNDACSNYKLKDPGTQAFPITGGGCYLFSAGQNVITFQSRSLSLRIDSVYREAFGFIAEGARALNFNVSFPNVTLTYTGLPYTVLFTPYEAVDNGTAVNQQFIPAKIPAPPLSNAAQLITYPRDVAGVEQPISISISSQQYYNPNSPSDPADQASEALGLQNDQEAVAVSQISLQLPPNKTYNSWRVQNLSPQTYYFRIGNSPVSGFSWDFQTDGANQQAIPSPNTVNGQFTFNFTLPNYPDFPWRKMPVFLPVKAQYLWVVIHSTPWNPTATTQLATFPTVGTMKMSMSCPNGPTIAHSSQINGWADIMWPFFVPFSSRICAPSIQIPSEDYSFPNSGYYEPDLGTKPTASFVPTLLSGSVTASESELFKATGWKLTVSAANTNFFSTVPSYKLDVFTTFNWGKVYSRSFRNTKVEYIEFYYGVARLAKK